MGEDRIRKDENEFEYVARRKSELSSDGSKANVTNVDTEQKVYDRDGKLKPAPVFHEQERGTP